MPMFEYVTYFKKHINQCQRMCWFINNVQPYTTNRGRFVMFMIFRHALARAHKWQPPPFRHFSFIPHLRTVLSRISSSDQHEPACMGVRVCHFFLGSFIECTMPAQIRGFVDFLQYLFGWIELCALYIIF